MLALVQHAAAMREHTARQEQNDQHIALFATCTLTRFGLAHHLNMVMPACVMEATSLEMLEQILHTNTISAIVSDARDHEPVCAIATAHTVPLLLVAHTPLEGLIASCHQGVTGVALMNDDPVSALTAALAAITQGLLYRSPELDAPFADLGLTPREQTQLVLEAQRLSASVIGERMGIEVKTVIRYRQRLRDKLGIAQTDDLTEWACMRLQMRERTLGA